MLHRKPVRHVPNHANGVDPTDAASQVYQSAITGNSVNPGVPAAFAEFMVGQAGNETGGFTSSFFVNNNNCFGYSCDSGSSWQDGCSTAVADNSVTVGNYDSINASTQEVVDWWYRRTVDGKGGCPSSLSQITSADQYATILSNAGYYTSAESSYASNISEWMNTFASAFHKR